MPRTILTDNQWNKLYNFLFCTGRIYKKAEHRKTVEGILYRIRTGIPWRDLPSYFGKWNTVFKRFNIWSKKGIIKKLLSFFNQHFDLEWVFIDGSIVKAHQDATGKGGSQAIGKSVAGNTTKLHLAVDSCGNPIDFTLTGGEVHDSKEAVHLLELIPDSEHIIADRGYDSQELREIIKTNKKAKPVIPRKRNSKIGNHDMDWCLYKYRHLVENAFAYLKRYRAVATRYDKTQRNYESVITLACCMRWLKIMVE
ncbi:IS5 family transposase [Pasteurella atlantica]|uniref:IS5 family transposase n=2 Tax=Pasteurellaceae TaxID=712 RepID=A0ACC6HJV2_9PAST|nr:IS5 family transposase [Pasteurella atlantica]MDP8051150.1 IS5 family transposase [Pasteurella atlantica]MDP8104446.1 IS5 family transposase [Pasteurella atlantica]MDP8147806.1 IS5 family transposase [Pasteurella atlantica]